MAVMWEFVSTIESLLLAKAITAMECCKLIWVTSIEISTERVASIDLPFLPVNVNFTIQRAREGRQVYTLIARLSGFKPTSR